jgi:hypothetical protein
MTLQKTKEYDKFIFRDDNRLKIDQAHVKRLVESIQSRNLLDLRPIIVNQDYEILDGQHRVLAAKKLGVDIYYVIEEKLHHKDIILMNVAKSWTLADSFNYHVKNHYPEYVKLKEFMDKENISLSIAIHMTMGRKKDQFFNFKNGKYKFNVDSIGKTDIIWDTINYIKSINGKSLYCLTARFWKALNALFSHDDFDQDQWMRNLKKFINRVNVRATCPDYLELFLEIYNHRLAVKLELPKE